MFIFKHFITEDLSRPKKHDRPVLLAESSAETVPTLELGLGQSAEHCKTR